ncbi:MAG: AAA family ATPase [Bacteroidaceae bacterium]|nr:AAA family ATPase [Bacteroidaceae bacterium]
MNKKKFYNQRPYYNKDWERTKVYANGLGGVEYEGCSCVGTGLKLLGVGLGGFFVKELFTPLVKGCGSRLKEFFFGKSDEQKDIPIKPVTTSKVACVQAHSLNEVLKVCKPSVPLVGNLIRSGERVVLFSFTGQGKSILAMQWAIELASGVKSSIQPSNDETQLTRKQLVVVYDAEQEADDLYLRYGKRGYVFPENLTHIGGFTFSSSEELLLDIKTRVSGFGSDGVIIIDNITAICPSFSAERAREFYCGLKAIQAEAQNRSITITFIIVGHTTKSQDWQALTESDLAGSVNLSNFATSIFALGPTKWPDTKLLKQLKGRKVGTKSTVSILQIQEEPYLHFEYLREEDEAAALKPKPKPVKETSSSVAEIPIQIGTPQKIVDLHTVKAIMKMKSDGKNCQKIEKALHFSRKTIGQVLNQVQSMNKAKAKELLEQGKSFAEIGKELGCRPAVVEYVINK